MSAFLTRYFVVCLALLCFSLGCGEGEDPLEPMEIKSDTIVESFGGMKKVPNTAPGAPMVQVPEGTPTVKAVGYYSDWRLTEPLSGTVVPGTTFFVKIVFSEAMKFKAANDNAARPILYYRHRKQQHRFRIAEHGASGEDFVSGDAKPLGGGTDDYICKYTVPADATGKFRIEIGKFNADLEGNNLPAFHIHAAQLQFGQPAKTTTPPPTEPETPAVPTEVVPVDTGQPQPSEDSQPPRVVEAGFYRDPNLTQPITDAIVPPGTSIYTKVVFSEPMQHRSVNIISARPVLSFVKNDRVHRYRVRSGQTRLRALASGDCKPIGDSTIEYICKYTVVASDWGTFTLKVGEESTNTAGVRLAVPYVHAPVLLLGSSVMRLSAATIEENKAPGAFIGTLSHISSTVPIYRLLEDDAQAFFSIDAAGHLRAKVRFNYEQRQEYTVVIEETQTQTRQRFDVQISDVNDPPTRLRLTSNTFSEEDGIGTKIGEVLVSDEDSGDVHEIEVVKGGDYVGVREGYLVVLKRFDTPSKTIELEATDSGGLKDKARFYITMQTSTTPPSEPSEPPQEDTQPPSELPPATAPVI